MILKILLFFALIFPFKVLAQQTIFNVPSADILDEKKVFIQHESQFRTKEPNNFINATNYFAYGVGSNTELDVTLFNLGSPASQNVSLGIGFKKSFDFDFLSSKEYKTKIIVGDMVPFSLQNEGVGNWAYIEPSLYFEESKTRITGGIMHGTKQIFGEDVICFLGGFEQKITSKINFISDYYSGKHALSIWASGLSYTAPRDLTFYVGYQIPNSKNVGRNSFVVEIAKIF